MQKTSKFVCGFAAFVVGTLSHLQGAMNSEVDFECIGISSVTILMREAAAANEQFIFNHPYTSTDITNNGSSDTTTVTFTINVADGRGADASTNTIRISSLYATGTTMRLMQQTDPNR